jgi:ATP-dependent Clp endopeptidase proteolytic subunit ClpP
MAQHKSIPRGVTLQEPEGDGRAELLLYGVIGFEVDSREVVQALNQLGAQPLTVRINSEGGSVTEGYAIFNALNDYAGEVKMQIDGLAASMGAFIAVVRQPVLAARNSLFMWHEAWDIVMGGAAELRKRADLLDQVNDQMATIFAARTGDSKEQIRQNLQEEEWLTGEQLVERGIADELVEPAIMQQEMPNRKTAEARVASLAALVQPPSGSAQRPAQTSSKTSQTSKQAMKSIAQELGLNAEANESAILQQVRQLQSKANQYDQVKQELDELKAEQERAQEQQAQQLVDQAVQAGTIGKEEAEHYKPMAKANPEGFRKLARLEATAGNDNGVSPAPGSINDKLNREGFQPGGQGQLMQGREHWTLMDWQQNAPQDLEALAEQNPEYFEKLQNAHLARQD